MADTRYFVYVTEPDEHYTTQSAAETAATELSEADQDSTYLVRGAVIETIANVSAAGVVTTTPVPDARWDNHHVGWHFDETTGTRAPVSLGNPNCTNSLVETGAATGYASGKFSNAARLACCPAQTLTANSLDFRLSGDWTWIGWIYKNASWGGGGSSTPIIAALDDSDSPDWGLFNTTGSTFFEFFDSASGSVTVTKDMVTTGQWYFISVVYNSTTRVARCALNATSFTNSSALGTGLRQLSTRFEIDASLTGMIFYVDEMHFFTEQKTDAEIAEFYNAGSGRLYPYG